MTTGLKAIIAIIILALATLAPPVDAATFDHFTTGYELTGQHRVVPCESCHVDAIFVGTPRDCAGCHSPGSRIGAGGKTTSHISSSENCDQCHTTAAWSPASRFSHYEVYGGCDTCHNGVQATGKTPDHILTTQNCDACHITTAWLPAGFDHAAAPSGSCATCHNGTTATGKTPDHLPTTESCDTCHTTSAWLPARFDHTGIVDNCASCHNGTSATGKNLQHINSTNTCESCHVTTSWVPTCASTMSRCWAAALAVTTAPPRPVRTRTIFRRPRNATAAMPPPRGFRPTSVTTASSMAVFPATTACALVARTRSTSVVPTPARPVT